MARSGPPGAERVDDFDLPRGVAEAVAGDVEEDGRHERAVRRAASRPGIATASASSSVRTGWNVMSFRASSGSSLRSGSFIAGRMIVLMPMPPRRQRLLADAADRQHQARERDFAGHRHVGAHRHAARRRHHRRRHRDAGRRAVLRDGARGHVDVEVLLAEELRRDAEVARVLPDVRQRGARRFLHHAAELAGQDDLARAAGQQRRFDVEDVAARLGPREAGRDAGPRRAERRLGPESRRAEIVGHLLGVDARGVRGVGGDARRHFARDRADLPLERAHAGLARVLRRSRAAAPRR